MASVPYVRLVIGGTIQNSQGWSIGLSFVLTAVPSETDLFTWLQVVEPDVHTWASKTASTGSAVWGPTVKYSTCQAYAYAAGSNRTATMAAIAATPVTGGNSKDLPPQLAIVASLLTGAAGRSNRGRVYIPFSASNALTSGQADAATCQEICDDLAGLIRAVAAAPVSGGPGIPSVVSSTPSGGHRTLSSVHCDSVVDTQRRRRDKIVALQRKSTQI